MPESLYCFECIHYLGEGKCLAFPKEIPERFYTGFDLHNEKVKGQKGDFVHEKLKSI